MFVVVALVALVVFVVVADAVIADAPLIFSRTFVIPNAIQPKKHRPCSNKFEKFPP